MLQKIPEIKSCNDVYSPSDDSWLMLSCIEINSGDTILDMGTGSGILGISAALAGGNVTLVDISAQAVRCAEMNARLNNVETRVIQSDLFGEMNEEFDVVIFNPPYLPSEEWSESHGVDRQWDGGGDGSSIIERFLLDLTKFLKPSGRCYLLFSSLTGKGVKTIGNLIRNQYEHRELGRKKLFFEILYVYELVQRKK